MAQIEIDRAADKLILANAEIEMSVIIPQLPLKTCNPYATLETQYLYNNMKSVEGRSVFFGQMDPFYLNSESTGKRFQVGCGRYLRFTSCCRIVGVEKYQPWTRLFCY